MPRFSCRAGRVPAALVALLVALLAGVLVCGGGTPEGGGAPAAKAVSHESDAGDPAAKAVTAAAAVVVGDPGPPGCGERTPHAGGAGPATPPRSGAFGQLLPALYDAHGGHGIRGAGTDVRHLSPGRAPPALVPPSPEDLSILRV